MGGLEQMTGASCLSCGKGLLPKEVEYLCPVCGGNLWVHFEPSSLEHWRAITPAQLAMQGLWAFLERLPLTGDCLPRFSVPLGGTPLVDWAAGARALGIAQLWLKDDTRLPSCSFKDRATSVALGRAIEAGVERVATASTGNAGCSLACLGAQTGQATTVFVPRTAPRAKIAQLLFFGAQVKLVNGPYDEAFDTALSVCRETGWLNRSTGLNPFTREGKKTVSFEIAAQLDWKVPDAVVVPTGDGNILSGAYKGFLEMHQGGVTDRIPRMIAAQSTGSDALFHAWKRALAGTRPGDAFQPVVPTTCADSISVARPRDAQAALKSVLDSGGEVVAVEDQAILRSMARFPGQTGIFIEPAAAAGIAALEAWVLEMDPARRSSLSVVVLLTGNGLKDPEAAMDYLPRPEQTW